MTHHWHEDAACKGTALDLFTDQNLQTQAWVLTTFCAQCPVRTACEEESARMGDYRWTVRGNMTAANMDRREEWVAPSFMRCGTPAGEHTHKRVGEPLCTPCKAAVRGAQRARYRRKKTKELTNE